MAKVAGSLSPELAEEWEWVLISPNGRDRLHQPRNARDSGEDFNFWCPWHGPNWKLCDRPRRGTARLAAAGGAADPAAAGKAEGGADGGDGGEPPGARGHPIDAEEGDGAGSPEEPPVRDSDLPWQVVGIRQLPKFSTIRDAQRLHDVAAGEAMDGLLQLAGVEAAANRPGTGQCAGEAPPAIASDATDTICVRHVLTTMLARALQPPAAGRRARCAVVLVTADRGGSVLC